MLRGLPHTVYEFTVDATLKGAAENTVTVYLPGGRHGEKRLSVAGMPSFEDGEQVVLFLTTPDSAGHAWPVGLSQGKFRIELGLGGPRVTQATAAGVVFHDPLLPAGPSAAAKKTASATSLASGVPLPEFLRAVSAFAGPSSRRGGFGR